MKSQIVFVILALAMLLSACAAPTPTVAPTATKPNIQVSDAWIRAANAMASGTNMGTPSSGGMSGMATSEATSAAYMILRNTGGTADKLLKAQTDAAKTVETHTTVKEGDVMKMKPVDGFDIPANGQTELKPGAFHIMLIGLTRNLKAGDTVKLTLTFEKAGQVQLDVPVRTP
jgi:periplasmic copper chaperone A